MAHDAIATCPICSGELAVTRLHCRSCGTTLEGDFNVGRFARLGRDQFSILESFLRARGNLKDMERELGISYPTVRARVDALVRALGLGGPDEGRSVGRDEVGRDEAGRDDGARDDSGTPSTDRAAIDERRRQILERLARREIGALDAAAALRSLEEVR